MFMVYLSVNALAGKETSADIAVQGGFSVKFLANRYASQIIFALFGSGGIIYGLRQRRLYEKATKKLQRVEKYEKLLDPTRSSSGLEDGTKNNDEDTL